MFHQLSERAFRYADELDYLVRRWAMPIIHLKPAGHRQRISTKMSTGPNSTALHHSATGQGHAGS
jgi:hypothetical protein